MNEQISKYLTEAMGECWHEKDVKRSTHGTFWCVCGKSLIDDNNDFFTWPGFGKLWEWAQQQGWWAMFCMKLEDSIDWDIDDFLVHHINPERFATAVYNFLKEREK